MIGPTCVVVPAGDFASAFADLGALEPVARVPFPALDPDASFSLAAVSVKSERSQKDRSRGLRIAALLSDPVRVTVPPGVADTLVVRRGVVALITAMAAIAVLAGVAGPTDDPAQRRSVGIDGSGRCGGLRLLGTIAQAASLRLISGRTRNAAPQTSSNSSPASGSFEFQEVYAAIRALANSPAPKRRPIGFTADRGEVVARPRKERSIASRSGLPIIAYSGIR